MFEREIKFIYDFNLNKINRLGPYFTFEQLSTTDIHPAILHYISAEIDYLVFEDRQNLLKNSVFDYSGEKINYHFNEITAELKKTKRFSAEYVAKLILHASSFTINYLIRPKWTLAKFVFDEASIKSTSEIKQILNYIYYYKYITKILISYINTKKILSMNQEEFEALLNKSDSLGTESYLSAIISNALKSMAEFFNIGEIKKIRVPLPAVELFLEEKELLKHLDALNAEFGNDENSKFNMYDYLKVLNKVMIEKKEDAPVAEGQIQFEGEHADETETDKTIVEPTAEKPLSEETSSTSSSDEKVIEEPIEETNHEKEKISEPEEDVKTKQPTKLRIRVGDHNRIEPIFEEEKSFSESENVVEENFAIEEDQLNLEPYLDKEEDEKEPAFSEKDLEAEESPEREEIEIIKESSKLPIGDEEEVIENRSEEEETKEGIIPPADEEVVTLDKSEIKEEQKDEPENESMFDLIKENVTQVQPDLPKLDLAELLERKEMTKIIEAIFDYDIEDFANTLEEISQCRDFEDAQTVIDQMLISRHISRNSKEAESFRTIILEFFNRA